MDRVTPKRLRAVLMGALLGFQCCALPLLAQAAETISVEDYEIKLDELGESLKYVHYIEQYAGAPSPVASYVLEAEDYSAASYEDVTVYEDYMGQEGKAVLSDEQGFLSWTVEIEEDGLYGVSVLYYPIKGKSADIQRALFVDGEIPYAEAGLLEYSRIWTNDTEVVQKDTQGNDIKPSQVEKPDWRLRSMQDTQGYHISDLQIYLSKGSHELSFVSLREPMLIRRITVGNEPETPDYETLQRTYAEKGYQKAASPLQAVEAEDAAAKSSPMLYPLSDHSSPAVTPYSIKEIRLNTIGSERWNRAGQWIEWEVYAEEDGLYNIGLTVLQNFVRGASVYRKLSIDGKVPFQEAACLAFGFKNNWRFEYLGGNEEPYLFYLTKGSHTLRLEVVLGEYAELAMEIEYKIVDLNALYREINRIVGSSPDLFRDYQLELKYPALPSLLKRYSEELYDIYERLTAVTGVRSSRDAPIRTLAYHMEQLSKDVEKFASELNLYKSSIGALGTWLMQITEQPLTLDTVYLSPPGGEIPKLNDSFFAKTLHAFGKLFYSFIIDYNSIGGTDKQIIDRIINVWIGTGRDQAVTMKVMIDENFTKNSGIGVNLMLVDMGTLLAATLAGQGPDAALQVGGDLPMNYGLRGAVTDLASLEGFSEVTQRFHESAMVPFSYDGKCYALPETQTFYMLFYRKDVLKSIGLEVPDTWQDVNASLSVLSKNNLAFGMPIGLSSGGMVIDSSFTTFLYQNGGQYYKDNGRSSDLDSDIAINSFKQWTKYYLEYGLERDFDFMNRFRTGEMPVGISDYTMYNTLQVAAPEIKGLWDFTLVPGTVMENGEINRATSSGGSAAVMMARTRHEAETWEFLKWWTSAEAQVKFGQEMEALMGPAARYPTANKEALESLPWPVNDFRKLQEQFAYVEGVPQVPGGYFTARNINNAFSLVVIDKTIGPREALTDYVRLINEEITSKRKEFNLD